MVFEDLSWKNLLKTAFSNINDTTATLFNKLPRVYEKFSFVRFPKSFPALAIDLIHDTRHLCTRLKVTRRSFSGGKQMKKKCRFRKDLKYPCLGFFAIHRKASAKMAGILNKVYYNKPTKIDNTKWFNSL